MKTKTIINSLPKYLILALICLLFFACVYERPPLRLDFKTQDGLSKILSIHEDSLDAEIYGYIRNEISEYAYVFIHVKTLSGNIYPLRLTGFQIVEPMGIQPKYSSLFEEGTTVLDIAIPRPESPNKINIKLEIRGVFKKDYLLDFDISPREKY